MFAALKKGPAEVWAHAPCAEAKCTRTLYSWGDSVHLVTWLQHGENREHRMEVTALDEIRGQMPNMVYTWLRRIHEYEAVGA